jgi:ABC-2 type transport system permease protein
MRHFIAVSVSEIFEAQTFSNFFRFLMFFLCGLFFPIHALPMFMRTLAYVLPLTYGVDILKGGFHDSSILPLSLDFAGICMFCMVLFFFNLRNMHKKRIA